MKTHDQREYSKSNSLETDRFNVHRGHLGEVQAIAQDMNRGKFFEVGH